MDHHQLKEAVLECKYKNILPYKSEIFFAFYSTRCLLNFVSWLDMNLLISPLWNSSHFSHFLALSELEITYFDVIFLSFPTLPEDSKLTFTEMAKPFWRVCYYVHLIISRTCKCRLQAYLLCFAVMLYILYFLISRRWKNFRRMAWFLILLFVILMPENWKNYFLGLL